MNNKKIALISGATSGIGASFAKRFAQDGYDLIITGRRQDKIQSLADGLAKEYNVNIEVIIAELADSKDIESLVRHITTKENIEILVNNAGFGIGKGFNADNIENQEKMVKVHVIATMQLIHAVIPQMIRRGRGAIINVSSIAAFSPLPEDATYCGTKAFLNNFSESLYMELREKDIRVQALCPGFTRTDFHEKMGMKSEDLRNRGIIRWMTADDVVSASIRSLKKKKVICIPGFWNKILRSLIRILPRALYYRIVSGLFS